MKTQEKIEVGWYPLDGPGMPLPGKDFVEHAQALGDEETEINKNGLVVGKTLDRLYKRATYKKGFKLPITPKRGTKKQVVEFIPGHIWNFDKSGPQPSDVLVLGKMPGEDEVAMRRNQVGRSGTLLRNLLEKLNIPYGSWYITNLCKFFPPQDGVLSAGWIKDCLPILHEELRLVRPKYILCLGSDAAKAILGKKASVSSLVGKVEDYTYRIEDEDHTAKVMVVRHPAHVLRQPEMESELEQGLCRWGSLLRGVNFSESEDDIDHRLIDKLDDLEALIYEMEQTCTDKVVAVDAEWHGEHPQNEGAYLRTVQVSWADKKAACIVLRRQGGVKLSTLWEEQVRDRLDEFFEGKRIVGHFLNADLEWLKHYGYRHVVESFAVPERAADGLLAWERTRNEGGADTGLMFHAIEETSNFKLEMLSLRYTSAPRYDSELLEWKARYCKEHDLKAKDLEGYGDCPDEILYPYANYDADVTRRLFYVGQELLDHDYKGNCCREPFWSEMRSTPAVLEMHCTGIKLDKNRVDLLTRNFVEARDRLEEKLKKWARWQDFNVRSPQHVREFLFGHKYNGKRDANGDCVRIRPEEAKSLGLSPLIDTSKIPVQWADIEDSGEEDKHTPSTNKTVLSILAQESGKRGKYVTWLRDYRFVDQVLKSVLRSPDIDPGTGCWSEDVDGYLQYSGGLPSAVCDDGRVRTHIYQTKETGRWSSARPPLQNISKQRDSDYKRILGKDSQGRYRYENKLRSMLRATRKGEPGAWCDERCFLIEADFTGAELCGMAWLSGDEQMMEHAARNLLPSDHPDHYDIHSNVAKLAFRLSCEPTKAGLAEIGKSHLRIVAKSVVFGVAYGRAAKAITLAAKEQGVSIKVRQAQAVIDTLFGMYPGLIPFFSSCRDRATDPGWICGVWGRFRRFPRTDDEKLVYDFQRQAMNFPIQNLVAGAMDKAIDNFLRFRQESGDPDLFRFLLQVHDAILLEVPASKVNRVAGEVIPGCMEKGVPIFPCGLDGSPLNRGPYYLGADIEVCDHWGEHITKQQCEEFGISEKFAA